MVDTTDLKSVEALSSCGFKSRYPHQSKALNFRGFFYYRKSDFGLQQDCYKSDLTPLHLRQSI